jgi:hypothetical protein
VIRLQQSAIAGLTCGLFAVLLCLPGPAAAQAQDEPTIEIRRAGPVVEQPRGDSAVIGSLQVGDIVHVLRQQGGWLLVALPLDRAADASWRQGWISRFMVDPAVIPSQPAAAQAEGARPPGRTMLRAFGQVGGVLFAARESFEALLEDPFGPMFGGGAQIVFGNGVFLQASYERFNKDGARVVASGDQIFSLGSPVTVTLTPIQATLGYRMTGSQTLATYLGGGAGVYRYREESPSPAGAETIDENHVGYHLLFGVEIPLAPWVSLAGEAQWAGVPKSIGEAGVSEVFGEDDLGGTAFRMKVIIGR